MRGEKAVWGMMIGSVLLQWYVMYSSDLYETALPFAAGLQAADTGGGNVTQILYAVIPVPFLLWLFSGRADAIVLGYGKAYIIRNYSREKLLLKEAGWMALGAGIIQCFAWALFQGFSHQSWEPLDLQVQVRVMLLYTLALIASLLLQFCLELIISQVYAQIVTLVYFAGSLFAYSAAGEAELPLAARFALFPNLGFAIRNGALEAGTGPIFSFSAAALLLVCALLIYIFLKILNKKDIM